ncbi:hypothetical protein FB45DRAFT_864330 [Roridomyces roridus]|uniref:Uncharacterized protein n=1 Tax=Roridomyces roridus TaxID=1738132 RepID=A0AAD7FPR4_9AGAR|nr:hypothetical protein FB45DRAFT_864330 [Roridomyces roridus]
MFSPPSTRYEKLEKNATRSDPHYHHPTGTLISQLRDKWTSRFKRTIPLPRRRRRGQAHLDPFIDPELTFDGAYCHRSPSDVDFVEHHTYGRVVFEAHARAEERFMRNVPDGGVMGIDHPEHSGRSCACAGTSCSGAASPAAVSEQADYSHEFGVQSRSCFPRRHACRVSTIRPRGHHTCVHMRGHWEIFEVVLRSNDAISGQTVSGRTVGRYNWLVRDGRRNGDRVWTMGSLVHITELTGEVWISIGTAAAGYSTPKN